MPAIKKINEHRIIKESTVDEIKTASISYLEGRISALENTTPLVERTSDPEDPEEGNAIIWMSDGTGAGDDGDIMIKITAGGVTKTATLVDFSGV